MSRGARLADLLEKVLDRLDAIEQKVIDVPALTEQVSQCTAVSIDVRAALDTLRTQQVTDRTDRERVERQLAGRVTRLEVRLAR